MLIVNKEGLEDAAADVSELISHAVTVGLKCLLDKFAAVAQHHLDLNKVFFLNK